MYTANWVPDFEKSSINALWPFGLREKGLNAEFESDAPVRFRRRLVGRFRPDLVVEQRVLVELKALPTIEPSHYAQVLNALRATQLSVGLLLNFGPKPQVKRLIATDQFRGTSKKR